MLDRFCAFQRRISELPERFFSRANLRSGKITILTVVTITSVLGVFIFSPFSPISWARADNVQTAVTVLNTPPDWSVYAAESIASATNTPTNAGTTLTFTATATDSSGDAYYLLICKNYASTTANPSAPPSCSGGVANQWAVSGATPSGTQATASTSTINTFPFNQESNAWYAYICDANISNPSCNALTTNEGVGDTGSPFVINHQPTFTGMVVSPSSLNPGNPVTWTATASDPDTLRGNDTVKLIVCTTASTTPSGTCGVGTWAGSTSVISGPATSTNIGIPYPDSTYAAYVYVFDNYNLGATASAYQGSNASFVVNNVASTIDAAQISLLNATSAGRLYLTVPNGKTTGFRVQFAISDDNSCQNASSTNEISSVMTNVYRSGVGSASCRSGDFNSNSCYPSGSPYTDFSCSQDVGSCSGTTDSTATWTCTFSLWYNADATYDDALAFYGAQNWLASASTTDDDSAVSSLVESSSGNELDMFLAFDVTQTSIAWGGLQPGQETATLSTTTDLIAMGNTGINENLYGDTMCIGWTAADSCDANGINATNDIPVSNQKFATSSVAFGSAYAYTLTSSSSPSLLAIRVPKVTATTSPQTRNTHWGIHIPNAITVAGDYYGQDTILATPSESAYWY